MPSEVLKIIITPREKYLRAKEKQVKSLGRAIKSEELNCPVCSKVCYLTTNGKAYADASKAKGVEVELICFACAKELFKKDPDKFFENIEEKHRKLLTLMFNLDDRQKSVQKERPNLGRIDDNRAGKA